MAWYDAFPNLVQTNVPLSMYTWFQLGGTAEFFAEPRSVEELSALVRSCHEANVPIHVLGSGSNVLVRSPLVEGLVIRLADSLPSFLDIQPETGRVRVSGNTLLSRLITSSVQAGLGGLEELIGIPGTVGAALHGNIGTDTIDIGQMLVSVQLLTKSGEIVTRNASELVFSYHQSSLDDCIVLDATFELHEENARELAQRMQKQWIIRKSLQPMSHQCAGRVFRNPMDGDSNASEIIASCGLKNLSCGDASISERHANYIVADLDCTVEDICALIEKVQAEVFQKTGISLELELEIW